jgi:ATP-dependent DNA ligase
LAAKVKPRFIEPMLLLRTEMLPEGPEWGYEIKLDGYRGQLQPADQQTLPTLTRAHDVHVR